MTALIIALVAVGLSFVNLIVMIKVDKQIAEKHGKSFFWREDK